MKTEINTSQESTAAQCEPFIDKPETARRLNCGLRTLADWMKRGLVPYYKISRRVVFKWSEIEAVMRERCRVNGAKTIK